MLKPYRILAFYHFVPIANPNVEVAAHKSFFENRDVKSRIYISEKGINGQMSAMESDAAAYMEWMNSRDAFRHIDYKIDEYHEHVFPKLTIKYRPNLVAFDKEVDLSIRGEHVSPEVWKEMLEKQDGHLLLDVRNDYEWKLGRFENATVPPCETFRDFDAHADQLSQTSDPKTTPVMMYCTGGIRCELYSSILKEKGFEKVYQLQGGVINYGKKVGNDHWLGKLFVFDDRLSVPISEDKSEVIGTCHHCGVAMDAYYNCANMDCNYLFLCCSECLNKYAGCCKSECQTAPRLRPYHHQNPHKPFRKWYQYFSKK
jgi:UPF0176 protein